MCPAPCDPWPPATPVSPSDPQSCQSSAGAVEASLVTSTTPPPPLPGRKAPPPSQFFNPSCFVSVLKPGLGPEGCSSSSDYQRHCKLSPTPPTPPPSPKRNQTVPNQCRNFDQTKTELLPKRCIRFADHLRWGPISRLRDQPGRGRETPILTCDWTVLRCLTSGGEGGGFYQVDSQNPKMELPLQPSSGQTLGTCVHFQQWLWLVS